VLLSSKSSDVNTWHAMTRETREIKKKGPLNLVRLERGIASGVKDKEKKMSKGSSVQEERGKQH